MKVLLLGGTGVLSTDILLECVNRGFETFVLNRGHHSSLIPKEAILIKGNIRNKKEVGEALHNLFFDVVVDFLSVDPCDLKSSFNFFESRCRQYIFISSACVFRRAPEDGILTESSPRPNWNLPYSINKFECEKYLVKRKNSNCNYTIIRPYITYGNTRIPFGIAPLARYHWTFIARILADKPLFLWDNGKAVCTLTHTTDFAYNFVQLLGNEKSYNEDFNLVGDKSYTWKEMLETLYKVVGKKPNYISLSTETLAKELPQFKEFLIGDRSLNAQFDNSKFKSVISDYQQHVTLEEGIQKTIDYYKNHNYLSGIDYVYDACIDRMISRHSNLKLAFNNYLKNATVYDRITYNLYRNLLFSHACLFFKIIRKLRRYL